LHRGDEAGLDFYKDDLPTNCVADWVCAEGSSAHNPGCGYHNLAVFYRACNFNCLGCQNWHYRFRSRTVKVESLLSALDECTRCVCFFGGDPGPDAPYALKFTQRALRSHPGLRICWETNGSENPKIFRQMLEASLKSGGTLKVDLKAWSESVNLALCGVTNQQSLDNLRLARDWISRRPEPPLLVVSTLLVPGYIDHEELSGIANFLVGLGPEIPWALLAFYPCFYLKDLPRTSHSHARLALEIAKDAGLERVRLGNQHLLSQTYQM
jgi:pyruvate formate lyase activating enzyme